METNQKKLSKQTKTITYKNTTKKPCKRHTIPQQNRMPTKTITKRFPKLYHSWVILQKSHKKGIWEKAMNKIVQKVHIDTERTQKPSYYPINSQSTKNNKHKQKTRHR